MFVIFLTTLLTLAFMQVYGDIMDSYKASLDSLVNDNLGVQTLENYFQQLPYKINTVDGQALVAQMASDMSDRLQANSDLIRTTRQVIEQGTGSSPVQKCSDVSATIYDPRFRNKIDLTSMCVLGSNLDNRLDTSVLTTMENNLKLYPTLGWQYFGTETGQTFIYPAVNRNKTDIDLRTKVWYTATANSEPKDVVILVQSSQSMSSVDQNNTPLIQIAKSAAALLIDTLNPDDRFGVVPFSNKPSTDQSNPCYSNELIVKSPSSTKEFAQFINNINPGDDGTYADAFQMAFTLLNNTFTTDLRDRVIIVLTNGYRIENDFNRTATAIRDGQRIFQNQVDIFVFGIGALNNDQPRQDLLRQLVSNTILDPTHESSGGQFSLLNSVTSFGLRTDMANFFTHYSSFASNVGVTYTMPYTDSFGLGLIMSICLPVSVGGQMKGVTCVDVTIDALFSEVSYFQQGSSSYSFLMDDYGRLLLHPYLPTPGVFSENSVFPDIQNIENDYGKSVELMRSSMLAHKSGNMTFTARRIYPRGVATLDGIDSSYPTTGATYFWKPVSLTNFTVCVVIGNADVNRSVTWQSPTLPPVYLSNEFSIQNLPPDSCNNYGRIARKDTTVVSLAATAFQQPSVYLDVPITNDTVQRWKSFLVNPTQTSTEIKAGVREAVAATYVMENFWRNSRSVSKFAVWRYIGTKEGVFRKYPGSRMVLEYDATKRPWYQQAVADFNRTSFYGPYVDASQTGCYISIAKAVTGNTSGLAGNSKQIAAVLALDATVVYFINQLNQDFRPCSQPGNTCFVIDRSGFLLIHNSFYPTSPTCNGISNVHITCSSESYIAWSLIQNKILINDYCISYVGMNKLKFWKIQLPGETTSFNGSTLSSSYTIYAVPQTNIFVIVKYGQSYESKQYCGCSQQFQTSPTCQVADPNQCEYPCFDQTQYSDICRGQLAYTTTLPPCIPPAVSVSFASLTLEEIPLSRSLCNCSTDVCEAPPTLPPTTTSSSSSVLGPAIGIPVGIVVALAIVIIVTVLIVRRSKISRNNNNDTPAKVTSPKPPFVTIIPVFDQPNDTVDTGQGMQSMGIYDVTGPSSYYQALRESDT